MGAKESATAKSTGPQEEDEMSKPDLLLLKVLSSKKRLSKAEVGYRILVIKEGAKGFQCRDCKYFLYSGACL